MTGVGAVFNTAKVTPGSSVVVYGCGGVGLNVIQGAALANATTIIAVDTLENKLEMAKQFGATHVVNSSLDNPVPQVQAITGGLGAEFGFEVVGKPSVITQSFDSVRPTGTAVVVGMAPAASNVVISTLGLFLNKTLTGSFYGEAHIHRDMPMLADLYMAGKLKLDELISRVYPLAQINDAFDAMKKGEVARSIIKFD
jgi:S-(hydroxymethyl)glutathione dehydrogenase/alcohol dehydrogenase